MNSATEIVLDTPSGAVRGSVHQGIACFRAIPYATPPIGEHRFEPPRAAQAWSGVLDAIHPGAVAPQAPSRLRHIMGDFHREQSEDCLTLTVWCPQAEAALRAVVVWFHGGAFMTGGGDLSWYDGERLAREGGVVVVAVNYRLGALGFLRAAGVTEGNLGLMDQALAVQWVERHIDAFGGDPGQVTLMGQSAGALSIALLLSRREALNAQRTILMSAPLGLPPIDPLQAEQVGEAFLRALSIDPQSSDAAAKAKQVPLQDVLRATGAAARFHSEHFVRQADASPPFLPVADGLFLASSEQHHAALRHAAGRLDVLIGTTRDESAAFGADVGDEAMTRSVFEDDSMAWAYRAAHAGRKAFVYRFDWAPEGSVCGAAHCIDLPFVFGSQEAFHGAPMLAGGSATVMDALSDQMRASWLAFMKNGAPVDPGRHAWPPVSEEWQPSMHFRAPPASA